MQVAHTSQTESISDKVFCHSIEPYPALNPTQMISTMPKNAAETRQLSATPTASATPAPILNRGRDLFRSATTPLDQTYVDNDDEELDGLREASAALTAHFGNDDIDTLPSLDELRASRSF